MYSSYDGADFRGVPLAIKRQTVADAGFGLEVAGTGWVLLEFAAELGDVNAQVLGLFGVLGTPDFVEQLALRHDAAGVFNEDLEEFVFVGGEVDFLASDGDEAFFEIGLDVAEADDGVASVWGEGRGAAEAGADT